MPQLDFTIAFPQIFYLFITFFFLYGAINHFFLPVFIKSLKTRKNIIIENNRSVGNLQLQLQLKQNFISALLLKNTLSIKESLEKNIIPVFSISNAFDFSLINQKLAKVLYYNTLYYDTNVLDSIPLTPKFLNLKNFKIN